MYAIAAPQRNCNNAGSRQPAHSRERIRLGTPHNRPRPAANRTLRRRRRQLLARPVMRSSRRGRRRLPVSPGFGHFCGSGHRPGSRRALAASALPLCPLALAGSARLASGSRAAPASSRVLLGGRTARAPPGRRDRPGCAAASPRLPGPRPAAPCRRADAAHLAHEMRGLAGQPLVRGGQLGSQLGDGRRLLVGLRLGGAQPRLQRDLAVLQLRRPCRPAARRRRVPPSAGRSRRPDPRSCLQRPDLALEGGVAASPSRGAPARTELDRRLGLGHVALARARSSPSLRPAALAGRRQRVAVPSRRCRRSISSACSRALPRSASISARSATSLSPPSPVDWRPRPPRVVSAVVSRSICAFCWALIEPASSSACLWRLAPAVSSAISRSRLNSSRLASASRASTLRQPVGDGLLQHAPGVLVLLQVGLELHHVAFRASRCWRRGG